MVVQLILFDGVDGDTQGPLHQRATYQHRRPHKVTPPMTTIRQDGSSVQVKKPVTTKGKASVPKSQPYRVVQLRLPLGDEVRVWHVVRVYGSFGSEREAELAVREMVDGTVDGRMVVDVG